MQPAPPPPPIIDLPAPLDNCGSKVGHLQLALVVRSKTRSTDVFNVLLD